MDVCNVKSGFSFPERFQQIYKNDLIPFFKVQDLNNYNFNTKTKFGISNKDVLMNKYKVFTKESICFAKVGEACKLNRKIKIKEKEYLVDNNLSLLFLLEEENNINFLFFLCLKINFNKFINNGSLPSISLLDLLNFPISIPSLPEQQKIAHFFSLLDKQIQLWERKLELYELKKKYFVNNLLNLFNSSPKLRFKGFNGEWEKKSLTKICEIQSGITYSKTDQKENGEYAVLRANNIFQNRLFLENLIYINKENINEKYFIKQNDILVCSNSGSIDLVGKSCIIDRKLEKFLIGGFMMVFRNYEPITPFLIQTISWNKQIKMDTSSTINSLTKQKLSEVIFSLPSLREQQKISQFLSILDIQIKNFYAFIKILEKNKKFYIKSLFI